MTRYSSEAALTNKKRLLLWTPVAICGLWNLLQQDYGTAAFVLALALWVELANEETTIERSNREHAEDCTRSYIAMLSGGRRKQRRPARVIEMSDHNGNEAA